MNVTLDVQLVQLGKMEETKGINREGKGNVKLSLLKEATPPQKIYTQGLNPSPWLWPGPLQALWSQSADGPVLSL